jgi:biotin synthase
MGHEMMPMPKWDKEKIAHLYTIPFMDLLFTAQAIHRRNFKSDEIELCTLLSIKTGACPENCAYCPQSGHYQTNLNREKLLPLEKVIAEAEQAKAKGATRFCMGAAWRQPSKKDLPMVIEMIKAVKKCGLETCVTLGMLDTEQAQQLKAAGLDFYNHNLDTSSDYYPKIISTHRYQDRLNTLKQVKNAGLRVCCGGILGMGESRQDRIGLLAELVNLPEAPESIPINRLIPIAGTPLEQAPAIDNIEFIRTIAITRILIPKAMIRLSAGRSSMSEEMQTLCFLAGANSMWLGDKLLTTQNAEINKDREMLVKLGIKPKKRHH